MPRTPLPLPAAGVIRDSMDMGGCRSCSGVDAEKAAPLSLPRLAISGGCHDFLVGSGVDAKSSSTTSQSRVTLTTKRVTPSRRLTTQNSK